MSRFQLVVLDMDGTLLNDKKEYTPRAAAAIKAGMERGVRFVLATARPYCSARVYAERLGIETPLVLFNGALMKEAVSGKTLYDEPLQSDVALELAAFCQERGLYMKVYGENVLNVEKATDETHKYSTSHFVPFEEVGDMQAFLRSSGLRPYSFAVHTEPDRVAGLKAEIERRWAGRVAADRPNAHAIHIAPGHVSKGATVRMLAESWGIPAERVLAIGDGGNDLEVIKWAGLGIAVSNATEELLAHADEVTASNKEDGAALALEKYLLYA